MHGQQRLSAGLKRCLAKGIMALRRWALQPLHKGFHDEHELNKYNRADWQPPELPELAASQELLPDLPEALDAYALAASRTQQWACSMLEFKMSRLYSQTLAVHQSSSSA